MTDVARDLGRFEARLDNMEAQLAEVRADVKDILAQVSAVKGGWRTLSVMAVIASTIGAVIAWVIGQFRP